MKEEIHLAKGHEGILFRYGGIYPLPSMLTYHTHAGLELNIVVSGTATYLLPGKQYTLKRGSLVWLFPEHPHVICERSKNYKMFVIVFSEQLIKRMASDKPYEVLLKKKPEGDFCRTIPGEQLDTLSSICNALCSENPDPDKGGPVMTWAGKAYGTKENKTYHHTNKEKLNAGLSYLLLEAWDRFCQSEKLKFNTLHPAVEKAVLELNSTDNYPNILEYNLEKLSRLCNISPARLSRLFHAQTGTPLINYRNQKRLDYFQHLVSASPHLTLSEAAFAAGFGSYAQFQKTFIKAFGYSPKEFRKKVLKNNER